MITQQRTPFICDDRSGWYKGAPTALLHDLIESAQRAVLIALTEVTAADRQKALHKVPGFDVHQDTAHGDADEIALLAKGAVWKTLHYEAAILGPDLGPGGREIAGILVLEHAATGARILVSKAHLPASVEGDFNGPRGRAHQACVQKWRARIKVLAARYDVDAQLVWADWNLDLHKPWVQAWIKKAWPELRLPDRIPAWSTHAGGRLIDWFLFTGLDIETWEQLPRSEASDHRGSRLAAAILAYKETPAMSYKLEHAAGAPSSTRAHYGYDDTPDGITIHHWGALGQKHDDVVKYLTRDGAKTSAHEVISAGRVTHLVDFDRAAWHAGSTEGNGRTIGLECRPEMSPEDWRTLVERCTDIEEKHGSMRYYAHSHWKATACPGKYRDRLDELVAAVNAEHARRARAAGTPRPDPKPAPTVHITRFLAAKTRAEQRAEAKQILDHGSPAAKAAAQKWLDAMKTLQSLEVK